MCLKILLVIEENSWPDLHIAVSLEEMGHIVYKFYFGSYVSEFYGMTRSKERKEKNSSLERMVRKLKNADGLDLIFCYVYDDFLLEDTAKNLEKLNVPIVNYNVDMPSQWFRQIKTAKYFTAILCAQPDNMKNIGRYAKKTIFFPMAARLFPKKEGCIPESPVTFVGTALPFRRQIIRALMEKSVPISVYGKYWKDPLLSDVATKNFERILHDLFFYAWPRFRGEKMSVLVRRFFEKFQTKNSEENVDFGKKCFLGIVSTEKISQVFCSSKINLGFTRFCESDLYKAGRCHMKLRDFEVPMAGGFYLVEKSPGYEKAFKEGSEVVTWSTFPELLEKIWYYLDHDREREAIALAGHKRALRDHTWSVRFKALFSELGID